MNVAQNPASGEDANYFEQEESQGSIPNNQLGLVTRAKPIIKETKNTNSSVAKPKPKVFIPERVTIKREY